MTATTQATPNAGADFDPILSQVVYNYELTVNREMGRTVLNLSGSPIFVGAADFACACLDADGNILTNIAWSLQMGYAIANTVRESIKRYGREDINPGDMIFCNDPYNGGGLHPHDVVLVTPVFRDDELVMWVGVSAHITDVGGVTPGGFTVARMEVYGENIRFTPVKFYEKGEYKPDIVAAFLTNVRLENRVELDLKAIMGACWLGRDRVLALLEQHGNERIKNVHRHQIQQSERQLRARVAALPDGVYTGATHMEHDGDEDLIYTIRATVVKEGENITFDFTGTDPQAPGVLNCTEIGTIGNVVAALGTVIAPDVPFNEGLLNAVEIISPLGTLVNSVKPAPVSGATVYGSWFGTDAIIEAMNYALAGSEITQHRQTGPWGCITWSFLHGRNQYNEDWVFIIFTGLAGGASALPFRDGVDAMGGIQTIDAFTANIEDYEIQSPVLFMNRGFAPDSAGPGKYRGGLALESLSIPWDTEWWHATTNHNRLTAPASTVSGAYPGAGSAVKIVPDARADVFDHWKRGEPLPLRDYADRAQGLPCRSTGVYVKETDGYYMRATGGQGYGDPLERDPAAVARDAAAGFVSRAQAEDAYGVVLVDDFSVDTAATESRRGAVRDERKARGLTKDALEGGPAEVDGERGVGGVQVLGEYLAINAEGRYHCRGCGHEFCSDRENWKWFASFSEDAVSPKAIKTDIKERSERDLMFREYGCPDCGTQIETEVALTNEAPRWRFRPLSVWREQQSEA